MSVSIATDINLSNDEESTVEETVQSLVEIVEQQSERIDDLEDELADYRSESAKDRAETKKRVTELEEQQTGDENPTPETGETTVETETPIEDVVQLPEETAQENLTANQERSRFVAKDIDEYSRSVPAGRAIKSSEIRRVLTAKEDGTVHTQTVSRVIGRLDDLGKDDVQVKETRAGERTVVFTEEIVERLACQKESHQVVINQEVSG